MIEAPSVSYLQGREGVRRLVRLDVDDCDLTKIPGYAKLVSVDRSANGGCHVLVEAPVPDWPCAEAVASYILGSDPMHALMELIRCVNGVPEGTFFDVKGIKL
jgi:hypothetical protein